MHFRTLLLRHLKAYPKLQTEDIFKFLHQSTFGPGHLISSPQAAEEGIRRETEGACPPFPVESLGNFSRVPLSASAPHTLGKLLFLSAKEETEPKESLLEKLRLAKDLIKEKILPFSLEEFQEQAEKWEAAGFPPVHHSEVFRASYSPSYRVIHSRFVPFLPLFREIENRCCGGRCILAIEGGSASGKTTLAALLETLYGATVFHMDDFFLRPEQRTEERYREVGGNVDRERFLSEVLLPLKKGKEISFRRFDCHTLSLSEPKSVTPSPLTVIEGAYSMHPALSPYYDFSVFLDIDKTLQMERIQKRNGSYAPVFFEKWIPLEETYFAKTNAKNRCNMIIQVKKKDLF